MNRPLSLSLLIALALSVSLPARAATPTEITELSATASGSTVAVSGTVAFGGEDPVLVGEDPVGDGALRQAGGPLGLDFEELLISQPGAASNLEFTIGLAGMTGGGIPEAVQYNWDIAVDGGAGAGGSNWSIKAMRSGTGASGDQEPYAAIYSCVPDPDSPTGNYACSSLLRLPVVFDEATAQIRITVPMAAIGAKSGSTIDAWPRNGEPVWARTSASGVLTGIVTADDMTHDTYSVPVRSTELGIVPAGTPEGDVTYTSTVSPKPNGTFTASFTEQPAGSYEVWARACGGGSCATRSAPVTVA